MLTSAIEQPEVPLSASPAGCDAHTPEIIESERFYEVQVIERIDDALEMQTRYAPGW